MYVTSGVGSMGCSVREVIVGHAPSVQELINLLHEGVTLVTTSSGYQEAAEQTLREAGFVPLVEYPNYAAGHAGNKCKLWAAVRSREEVRVLPERKKFPLRKRKGGVIVDKAMEQAKKIGSKR